MAEAPTAEALRAMAEHRGLKLVRSRRRTPGVGDYGKYGLTDATGTPLLGIGADGLTASASEIEAHLRGGAAQSWKISAETEPARPSRKTKSKASSPEEERPVQRKDVRRGDRAPKLDRPERARQDRKRSDPPPRAKPTLRIVEAEPAPEPALRLRAAKADDANALAALLRQLNLPPNKQVDVATNIADIRKTKGGLVVAELDGIAGCCSWTVIPTLQRGKIGRLTLLLVDADHRRRGIARAMIEVADTALAKAGCSEIEAMSDIMINNAHNFFRALGFEQKSYRFVRAAGSAEREQK